MNQYPRLRIRDVPRENDDKLLEWMAHREAGWSFAQIGKKYGVSYQTIQAKVNAVLGAIETTAK